MKKYNEKQIKEIDNILNKIKQPVDIAIPIDCYRNSEIKKTEVNHQSRFSF